MVTNNYHFFDSEAAGLHDTTVYDILKKLPEDTHPTTVQAILGGLDDHDLEVIGSCTDWDLISRKAERIASARKEHNKPRRITYKLNYRIEDVLDDYVNHRTGKRREAHRQLLKRFDGLDHEHQEAAMLALMSNGTDKDRAFIYKKLYEDDFWVDDYIPLVEKWFEEFHDGKICKVVVKRCSREYVIDHLEELIGHCNYASLCLKTGLTPEEGRLPYRTHLFVIKSIGGQLRFREGEETILRHIREFLYEDESKTIYDSIFDIPYVKRMMMYLGEMGLTEDILALEAFDKRMQDLPRIEWGTDIIKAIEDEFSLPEYVFKEVK